MLHVLTSKKAWALTALVVTGLVATTSAVSAAPAPAPQSKPAKHSFHLDFSADPQAFGGVGTVSEGKPAKQVGMVYDQCNKDSAALRTDLIYCAGVIRFVSGKDKGLVSFQAAAPRPLLAAHLPIHFAGTITGGTCGYKGLNGEIDFTKTGGSSYDVTFG